MADCSNESSLETEIPSRDMDKESLRIMIFEQEWPRQAAELETQFKIFETSKHALLEIMKQLESILDESSSGKKAHDGVQKQCKFQSVCGGALGLVGILAAPVSGGLSLALTVGSAATQVHGIAKEYKSKRDFSTATAQTMDEVTKLRVEFGEKFMEIQQVVKKIEKLVETDSGIDRIVYISSSAEAKPSQSPPTVEIAGIIYKPLAVAWNRLKTQPTAACGYVSNRKSVLSNVYSTLASAKQSTETILKVEPVSRTIQASSAVLGKTVAGASALAKGGGNMLFQAASSTFQFAQYTVKHAASASGLASSGHLAKFSQTAAVASKTITSKVTGISWQLAEKGNRGFRMTREAISSAYNKAVVGKTMKTTAVTKSICKVSVALGAVTLCTDLYSLATHKGPEQLNCEKDIQSLIEVTKKFVDDLDAFMNEARDLYQKKNGLYENMITC